jgi:lauroyl/myristoyl acyltransferase
VLRTSAQLAMLRAGVVVAGALPAGVSRVVAEASGVVAGRLPALSGGRLAPGMARRRRLVAAHLGRLLGPELGERALAAAVDRAFASYARYWAESLRLPSLSPAEVAAGMTLRGFEHVEAALGAGGGVIVALPHLGGWEWGGRFLAAQGLAVSVVVEALEPPEIFEWFAGLRRQLGLEVIPVGPDAGRASLRALRANRVLCLLSDRVVGDTLGVEVRLFGSPTRLPAGPVTLALRTGAPLLPAAVYFGRGSDEHLALVRPPIPLPRSGGRLRADVEIGTQHLAAELETLIRRAPTQWHLMSPAWPGDEALGGGG